MNPETAATWPTNTPDLIYISQMVNSNVPTHEPGKAEVAEFDNALRRQQDVLWLDVAVDAVVLVAVGDALQGLPGDATDHSLRTAMRVSLQLMQHCVLTELEH